MTRSIFTGIIGTPPVVQESPIEPTPTSLPFSTTLSEPTTPPRRQSLNDTPVARPATAPTTGRVRSLAQPTQPTQLSAPSSDPRPRGISLRLPVPKSSLGTVYPTAKGVKRSLDSTGFFLTPPSVNLAHKKQRLNKRPAHNLHPFNFVGPSTNNTTPPSPLFFSNTPSKARPILPPRFSSSEAAARMLSKTQSEDSGIKTVTLARGSFTGSPPLSRPAPRSRQSVDRYAGARSDTPETGDGSESSKLLSQIGITEVLEQDDRPTFMVDLTNAAKHNGGSSMRVIYANPALKSYPGLLEAISKDVDDREESPLAPKVQSQFKAWALSARSGSDSFSQVLPIFGTGYILWNGTTVRKRLRIIRGVLSTEAARFVNSTSAQVLQQPSPAESSVYRRDSDQQDGTELPSSSNLEEPQDYFGAFLAPVHEVATEAPDTTNETVEGFPMLLSPDGRSRAEATVYESALSGRPGSDDSISPTQSDTFKNECVLSAAAAGDVDRFLSRPDSPKEVGFFDWTRLPVSDNLPPHIQFARSVDWAATPLGPIEHWSADLRQMCNLIMASPHPAAMYWGDDLVAIYNEAYVLLAGQKHPKLMGQSYREAWIEIWDDVKDVFAGAQLTGQATMKDDDCLFLKRHDFLEETYFSWSIIPLVGGDGSVMGLYNPAFEKTRRKIAERRMLTLREVGERTAAARDIKSFWGEVLESLKCNDFDTPIVLLYSISDDTETDGSSITSSSASTAKQCYLEGSLGVPEGHICAPSNVELRTSEEGFVPTFREALRAHKPRVLDSTKGELPEHLLDGLDCRGFGDATKAVVVCPIQPTTGESTLGFLVMGINPRRPYDDDYALFVQLLSRQLATSLASVVLFEEEIKRGQRAAKLAALDRIELSEQLAARTQEAIESETKFTRMAEFAPVGMFIADSDGRITFCNDTWYEISRVPRDSQSTDRWVEYVMDEDKQLVRQTWHDLVHKTKSANVEFRFKASWIDRNGVRGDTWVLFSAYPERYDDGSLKSIFGSITNISQQKWAEGLQKRKMEEAVELKRQQENFIDITSHEMRNPLSAILQCSDEIITSLSEARRQQDSVDYPTVFADSIDAAQTIALCAQHQKRIVDDVLTLSKLDSALLMVTPVDVQPLAVVQRALKMFEGELQNADIQLKFVVDPSIKALGIDWIKCDPSRVLQVLINLTTNAIKFTTTEAKRTIIVTITASLERPSSVPDPLVSWLPSRAKRTTTTEGVEWGNGEEVFINFAVEDTGRGLTTDEKKLLFQRFSQASPRTHVQYGGSGLGLFISRELTELQGGEIGVASEAGKGSTFAFYIRARRSVAPKNPVEQLPQVIASRRTTDGKPGTRNPPPPKTRDFASEHPSTSAIASTVTKNEKVPLRVLIVEDNLVNQRVLQKQLKNLGCITYLANHGGEALDQLRNSWYWKGKLDAPDVAQLNVVLMDQEMPIMGGLECTKRIRQLEREGSIIGHVPIIAVTANARDEQVKTILEAGMDDVVSKPFRIQDLVPKIEELKAKYQPEGVPQ